MCVVGCAHSVTPLLVSHEIQVPKVKVTLNQAKVSGCHGLETELRAINVQWMGLVLAYPTL